MRMRRRTCRPIRGDVDALLIAGRGGLARLAADARSGVALAGARSARPRRTSRSRTCRRRRATNSSTRPTRRPPAATATPRPTSRMRKAFLARLKAVDPLRVITTVTRDAARRLPHDAGAGRRVLRADRHVDSRHREPAQAHQLHARLQLRQSRERSRPFDVAKSIVDMQKVYPRDRDLPMLLYWCYTTLQRMTDTQSRAPPRRSGRFSRSSTRTARKPASSWEARDRALARPDRGRRARRPAAVCLHDHVPLPVPDRDDGVGAVRRARITWKAARNGDEKRRARRAFGPRSSPINFAAGVVPASRWSSSSARTGRRFRERSGAVIGQPLAMEGIFAFFLESIFLGVLLYARGVGRRAFRRWSALLGLRSGRGSRASSSSLPTRGCSIPSAIAIAPDGTIELESIWAVLFSAVRVVAVSRTCSCGAMVAGGLIVAGVGAYYLLSGRDEPIGAALRARGHDRRVRLLGAVGLSDRRRNGADVTVVSAGEAGRDGRALRTDARRAAGDHRHAGYRSGHADRSDRRPELSELSRLRKLRRERQRARRLRARAVAAGRADVLRVPHHGRARHDLRAVRWRSRRSAAAVRTALSPRAGCSGC